MSAVEVTITIDPGRLRGVGDEALAMYWHVAQANPAPHGDAAAGQLTEQIGREIIRRWLAKTPPELYHHQGRDYYWNELRQLGKWHDGVFVPDVATSNGDQAEASA